MRDASPSPTQPFSAKRLRLHRARAAQNGVLGADFLLRRVAADLADRLETINRPFERMLEIGGGALRTELDRRGRDRALHVVADGAEALATAPLGIVADPERSPFADGSFDLIAAPLSLHWVNDLPGALIQARRALKSDGLFLGAMFGGRTLNELRAVLTAAESEIRGGAGLRVAPFADLADAAALVQRAGMALPVADSDLVSVTYPDLFALLRDLRGMGETSALADPAPPLSRAVLAEAAALYPALYPAGAGGRIRASFEILTLTGWAPHESQPKPLAPGSATTRLANALGAQEIPLKP